jgi:hypothetical protein
MRLNAFICLVLASQSLSVLRSKAEESESPQLTLAKAAFKCNTNRIAILLDRGTDINGRVGTYDKTAFAFGSGFSPIGSPTWTPLMAVAASFDHLPEKQIITVHFLLKRGARIDDRDSHGASALHIAIDHRNFELAVNLLKLGANPNGAVRTYIDDVDEQTALHRALGSPMVVEALIKYGADVNAKDAEGNTALDRAEARGLTESARLLRLAPKSKEQKATEK